MALEFVKKEETKTLFTRAVNDSFELYSKGTLRINDSMLDVPAQTVTANAVIKQTVHLTGFVYWSIAAIQERWPGIDPVRDLHAKWESLDIPGTGEIIEGYKILDDGYRPLPFGARLVDRAFERNVEHKVTVDDGRICFF